MAEIIAPEEQSNLETFRDYLSEPVLRVLAAPFGNLKSSTKKRARRKGKEGKKDRVQAEDIAKKAMAEEGNAAEDLGDFIEVQGSDSHDRTLLT